MGSDAEIQCDPTGIAETCILTEGFLPLDIGLLAISNTVAHIRPAALLSATKEQLEERSKVGILSGAAGTWPDHLRRTFTEVLAEVLSEAGPPDAAPTSPTGSVASSVTSPAGGGISDAVKSLAFMRHLVRMQTGHVLSDVALREVRLGALYALKEAAATLRWAEGYLPTLCERVQDASRIDNAALQACGAGLADVVREYEDLLQTLPAPASQAPALDIAQDVLAATKVSALRVESPKAEKRMSDKTMEAEATELGASLFVWQALPSELRPALKSEFERIRAGRVPPWARQWTGASTYSSAVS